jgi:hypothetical protein
MDRSIFFPMEVCMPDRAPPGANEGTQPASIPSQDRSGTEGAADQGLADAILRTVVYADLFDFPLTIPEIHRYLTGSAAPMATIEERLLQDGRLGERMASYTPYWFLTGREELVELRREREAYAQVLWPAAWRYGRLVASIPFVRLVAVTGSLSMNNVLRPDDDIDYLIVTRSGRLWLARGAAILVVHLARRAGIELCPNYVMAEGRLVLGRPSLYNAHELAQLVPLFGLGTYRRLYESNPWMTTYLPNASPREDEVRGVRGGLRVGQRLVESVLGGRLGDAVERWERERKIPRLYQVASEQGGAGAVYSADLCKGHVDDHAAAVYREYAARLAAQGM